MGVKLHEIARFHDVPRYSGACHGKVAHVDKPTALAVMRRRICAASFKSRGGMGVYRCPNCRLWHIGSVSL